ncbi:hypothetical protein [Treponema sp. R6D11]
MIETQPNLNYVYGEKLDLTALKVEIFYDDITSEIVQFIGNTKNISANPAHNTKLSVWEHSGKPVTVSLGDKSAETSNLTVSHAKPVVDDFNISGNMTQTVGSVTGVTITPKSGKSDGIITVFYQNGSSTSSSNLPTNVGNYTVTFSVAASSDGNWVAETNLQA